MAGLLLFSGFFSGSETALFLLSREQLRKLESGRGIAATAILALTRDPTNLLVTVLFGNMIVNVLFFCMSAVLAGQVAEVYGAWAQAVSGLAALMLVIVFGEILPKAVGISHTLSTARAAAVPLLVWQYAVTPVRVVLRSLARRIEFRGRSEHERFVTPEELKMLVEMSRAEGLIGHKEGEMIADIVEIAEIRVREIMVPRVDVVRCEVATPAGEVLALARENTFSLVPVYEGDFDHVLGVVSARDLFLAGGAGDLRTYVKPVKFVPETKRADALLRQFLDEKLDLVIVVDEYGGTAGLATLEDLLEAVIGEIEDEFEPDKQPVESLGEKRYRLHGGLSIREWRDLFAVSWDRRAPQAPELDTIGGFVIFLLGRIPREGDQVRYQNLRFTVERVQGRRIATILLEIVESGGVQDSGPLEAPT